MTSLKEREERLKAVDRELGRLRHLAQERPKDEEAAQWVSGRLGQLAERLRADTATARKVLREMLDGPLVFTPRTEKGERGYSITARFQYGPQLDYTKLASPTGFEPVSPA